MNKIITSAITGAAVTMAVGTAAYMASGKNGKKRQMKKTAAKAVHAVGEIVNGIGSAMR